MKKWLNLTVYGAIIGGLALLLVKMIHVHEFGMPLVFSPIGIVVGAIIMPTIAWIATKMENIKKWIIPFYSILLGLLAGAIWGVVVGSIIGLIFWEHGWKLLLAMVMGRDGAVIGAVIGVVFGLMGTKKNLGTKGYR